MNTATAVCLACIIAPIVFCPPLTQAVRRLNSAAWLLAGQHPSISSPIGDPGCKVAPYERCTSALGDFKLSPVPSYLSSATGLILLILHDMGQFARPAHETRGKPTTRPGSTGCRRSAGHPRGAEHAVDDNVPF